jgi:hypothetical protein
MIEVLSRKFWILETSIGTQESITCTKELVDLENLRVGVSMIATRTGT